MYSIVVYFTSYRFSFFISISNFSTTGCRWQLCVLQWTKLKMNFSTWKGKCKSNWIEVMLVNFDKWNSLTHFRCSRRLLGINGHALSAATYHRCLPLRCAESWTKVHGKSESIQFEQRNKSLQLVSNHSVHIRSPESSTHGIVLQVRVEMYAVTKSNWWNYQPNARLLQPLLVLHFTPNFGVCRNDFLCLAQEAKPGLVATCLSSHCCRWTSLDVLEV